MKICKILFSFKCDLNAMNEIFLPLCKTTLKKCKSGEVLAVDFSIIKRTIKILRYFAIIFWQLPLFNTDNQQIIENCKNVFRFNLFDLFLNVKKFYFEYFVKHFVYNFLIFFFFLCKSANYNKYFLSKTTIYSVFKPFIRNIVKIYKFS